MKILKVAVYLRLSKEEYNYDKESNSITNQRIIIDEYLKKHKEYKIYDYFIDMLFYHLKLHCYVGVELKAVPFKPEFIGKLNFYLNAVDDLVKDEQDEPSIGLLLCKGKDKLTVDYSLKGVDKPIGVSSYETSRYLPKNVIESLPTEEEINLHIDIYEDNK